MSVGPRQSFASLAKTIALLEKRFLQAHLGNASLTVSNDEHVDVSAFVVLAHAAFESYLETVAQWVLNRAVDNWTARRRISRATACLLLSCDSYDTSDDEIIFDRIRKSLDRAKGNLSRVINTDNHGISIDHIRRLFVPLGVELPKDASLWASIQRLSKLRGQMAHRHLGATVVTNAKDAKNVVSDCMRVAVGIAQAAVDVKP